MKFLLMKLLLMRELEVMKPVELDGVLLANEIVLLEPYLMKP
jgi:hypothetical protein